MGYTNCYAEDSVGTGHVGSHGEVDHGGKQAHEPEDPGRVGLQVWYVLPKALAKIL